MVVTEAGEAAAVFRASSGTSLAGFDWDGTAYELDRGAIPQKSLRRTKGSGVSWTKSGARRTAELDKPAVSCAKLAGVRVRRTDAVNIVSFNYASEFISGELTGSTQRIRGCALPDGPVRVLGESEFATGSGVQGGSGFSIASTAGTFLLERESSSDSQGDFTPDSISVHDLATDKRVKLWGNADAEGPNTNLGSDVSEAVITSTGQAGLLFAADPEGQQVVGFDPAGKPRVLDTAQAMNEIESLTVSGTILSWKNKGERRTADLAAP